MTVGCNKKVDLTRLNQMVPVGTEVVCGEIVAKEEPNILVMEVNGDRTSFPVSYLLWKITPIGYKEYVYIRKFDFTKRNK